MEYYKNFSLEPIVYQDEKGLDCIEQWRDIPNYEDSYLISDLGRVKSMPKEKNHSSGKRTFWTKEKILKQPNNGKYLIVSLSIHNKKKSFLVHQLVAIVFLNHKPNRVLINVDHINNVKKDNRLVNLQLITPRENSIKDKINKTGFTGIYEIEGRFRATITFNGEILSLGSYDSPELASEKYQEALCLIKKSKNINNLIKKRFNANGFTGVIKNLSKFQARINHKGKSYNLGNYDTQEEAGAVYLKAFELSKQNKSFEYLIKKFESQTKSKGISISGDKFRVRFYSNGKNIGLGTFDTLEKAKKCYNDYVKNKKPT